MAERPSQETKAAASECLAPRHPFASMRHDTFWALCGGIAQSIFQLAFVASLSRWTSTETVGRYAWAVAVVTPIHLFADRALRTLQATEGNQRSQLTDLLGIRAAWGAVSLVLMIGLTIAWRDAGIECLTIVALLSLQRWAEGMSQVVYGRWHQLGQLRRIGYSQMMRAVVAWTVVTGVLAMTRQLEAALLATIITQVGIGLTYDRWVAYQLEATTCEPRSRLWRLTVDRERWWRLLQHTFTLGLATFLVAVTNSLPRLYLARGADDSLVGIHAVGSYLAFPATLIATSLMQAAVPRLAWYYQADRLAFWTLYRRVVSRSLLLAGVNLCVLFIVGQRLLVRAFGDEYHLSSTAFAWLMAGSCVSVWSAVPATTLTAQRRFRLASVLCASSCLICWALCQHLIDAHPIEQALMVTCIAQALHGCMAQGALWWHDSRRLRPACLDRFLPMKYHSASSGRLVAAKTG